MIYSIVSCPTSMQCPTLGVRTHFLFRQWELSLLYLRDWPFWGYLIRNSPAHTSGGLYGLMNWLKFKYLRLPDKGKMKLLRGQASKDNWYCMMMIHDEGVGWGVRWFRIRTKKKGKRLECPQSSNWFSIDRKRG